MANLITIFRIFLAIITISLLFFQETNIYLIAFFLTIIVIWMDGFDGYVARKFNETSKFGAVLDILGDRIVENIYWIVFSYLGWIPVWIPLVVVTRGIITDGLRSVALEQGYTAFGSSTMMSGKISKFIVASNFSRFSYALFKALAFALLILVHAPGLIFPFMEAVNFIAYFCAYASVFFCVARGLPVITESKRFFPSKS